MKLIKRLILSALVIVVLLFAVLAIGLSLIDVNDYKDKIQNLTKTQTGRDLAITGDLDLSYFPWFGITLGKLSLANAEGFGDTPFAEIDSADVKVELLPLLRKTVNVKTVELKGLKIDLQRAADGTTNWDDLANREPTTTSTTENDTTTEVEGDAAAIAALAVGGIEIADANISWLDKQAGSDAKLSGFNLKTGAIELAKPFRLDTDFNVNSGSAGVAASVKGGGEITIDLDNQRYTLAGFKLDTAAKGETLPGGAIDLSLASNLIADLAEQSVNADKITLSALGITLNGSANVTQLDTDPQVSALLTSESFNPLDLFAKLGIDAPVTADPDVLKSGSLSLSVAASPAAAALKDLTIKLDDTTFKGSAQLPNLAAAMPPVRFDFNVDAIDLDRYLPPPTDEAAAETQTTETGTDPAGDVPIDLPMDMIRQLDVEGVFSVGQLKIMNLTTNDIKVPLQAKKGVVALEGIQALMYDGRLDTSLTLNAQQDVPSYSVKSELSKVESDPLLKDLRQANSPLSGNANFAANLVTSGASVNALKAGLNGDFNTAFKDGSINGINIGYQIRRAKAALKGQQLNASEKQVKTDFSSLTVSGRFANGVMTSEDLDMRSPLLRLSGAGTVDLVNEYVDYTPSVLVSGTTEGQGGKDLEELKGLNLDVPIQGKFADLSADFTGAILSGLKANFSNLAKDRAKAEAEKLKAEAKAKLNAVKADAQKKLDAEKAAAEEKAREQLAEKQAEAEKKVNEAADKAKDKLKGKLKGLLK